MKFLLFFACIPSILSAAAFGPKDSPKRNVHSKSAGEIPSLADVVTVSQALDIPTRPGGHERKRSSSELELKTLNPWASPTSSSSTTPWSMHRVVHSTKPQVATHRPPRKLSNEELSEITEEKWRSLRKSHFGPKHKRTRSLPSHDKLPEHFHLMELSEQYAQAKQMHYKNALFYERTIRAQKEFLDAAGKAAALLTLMETTDFEACTNKISSSLAQHDKLAASHETRIQELTTKINSIANIQRSIAQKFGILLEAHAATEPTSPRSAEGSKEPTKDRRKSNSSFLGFQFGSGAAGSKD